MSKKHESIYQSLGKNYYKVMVDNLKKFCAIDSTYDASTADEKNPFGKGVSKALKFIEELAKKDGFTVTNYDNKIVEILEGDKKEKNITILAHADVVPPGNGWKHNPFEVLEKKDVLYGRGVSDDKGPLLASYYALKMLKDNHLLGDYQVRLLVGGNEESGSACMEHYFHTLKKYQPTLGFSPDADYPLIYGEKAIINYEVKKAFKLPHIYSFKGGTAFNCVIEEFEMVTDDNESLLLYLEENKIKHSFNKKGNKLFITIYGKSAHGSAPQDGINAGMIGISTLAYIYEYPELIQLVKMYSDVYGRGVDAYNKSEDMGENSLNVGLISYDGKDFSMTVNFRHVNGVKSKDIIKRIKKANKPFKVDVLSAHELLYYPQDSVLVSTLLKVYQEETNDYKSKPLAIGGGTYAKDADNVVAFGMQFPGVDLLFHSPDEYLPIKDLYISLGIYAHAIVELGKKIS